MSSRALSLGLAVALGLAAAGARAAGPGDDKARAREAYDRGAAAHDRGDHAAAAKDLALADAILPNPVTLRAALEEAIDAGDPVLAIELCDRTARGPVDPPLAALVHRARSSFARRVGKVRVDCGGAACSVKLDGAPLEAGRATIVRAGRHALVIDRDGAVEERAVEVDPEGTASVLLGAAGPRPPPIPADAAARPPPGWFAVTLAATAVVGGVTIGFGADTASKHDAFVSAGCQGPAHGDCSALAAAGSAAQLRTDALAGVTAALGVATVVAGVLTFRTPGAPRVSLVASTRAAALRLLWP